MRAWSESLSGPADSGLFFDHGFRHWRIGLNSKIPSKLVWDSEPARQGGFYVALK
jgi:hypothetical protein